MSRIGLKPIAIPAGVDVSINGNAVTVKGPNGTLTMDKHPNISVSINDGEVNVARPNDDKENRALHGLTRALIANMVEGVTNGFKKSSRSKRCRLPCSDAGLKPCYEPRFLTSGNNDCPRRR